MQVFKVIAVIEILTFYSPSNISLKIIQARATAESSVHIVCFV